MIKGNPNRRPPEPSVDHAAIDELFVRLMPRVQPLVRVLDELICDTVPGLQFGVKFSRPFYGLPERGWIIELAPYHLSVNVVFLGGADFDSPPPLGTVGRSRYVKLTAPDEVLRPDLHDWIEQAARVSGWR
ncbi:MAG: DUF1801 domain-containing protein [Marmoricola sp.]